MTNEEKHRLLEGVDDIPELLGAGVAFIHSGRTEMLRESQHSSGLRTLVIIEELTRDQVISNADHSQGTRWHKMKIGKELVGAGFAVPSTILAGWTAADAGILFASITEASFIVAAGALLASFQLGVQIGRAINEVIDPRDNERLDTVEWWKTSMEVLDVVGLLMDLKGLPENVSKVAAWRRATNKPLTELFAPLTRQQRKQFAKGLALEAEKISSSKEFKALVRAGKIPTILPQQKITRQLQKALLETVNSAFDFGKSNADGAIHQLRVHIAQGGA